MKKQGKLKNGRSPVGSMSDEEYPEFTAAPAAPETEATDYGTPLAILGGLLVLAGFGLGLQAYMAMSAARNIATFLLPKNSNHL